jgi:hypothetical protein
MGKSFDDYPTIPRISTDGVDAEDVIDRRREKLRCRQMYSQTADQKKIFKELIRVQLNDVPLFALITSIRTLGDFGL